VTRRPPLVDPDTGPLAVGGVGGSGTRVVAEMMRHLGLYTGADLNKAGDNKWFTLLCKLPRWDPDPSGPDAAAVDRSLDLFERAMTGQLAPALADRLTLRQVVARVQEMAAANPLPDDRDRAWWRAVAASLRGSRRLTPATPRGWGWKEPNTHLFVPQLQALFGERLRYVHVIRNGVYMAHSANQAQVQRWGPGMGIAGSVPDPTPTASLDYWIAANRRAIERGRAMAPGAFLLVNYDELCADPRTGVARFLEFLGFDPPAAVVEELVALPRPPKPPSLTPGEMVEAFGEARLAEVRQLGFAVPAP
jgi:hypothetical protein